MTPGYGISFTVWCSPTPGTLLWPFTFSDGYLDKRYVKVRYKGYDEVWYNVVIDPETDFYDDNTLRISPVIPPCIMVDIYRDTPKDYPIVVYGNGGGVLKAESRSAAVRQSLHVIAELKELANRSDLVCLCDCRESPTMADVVLTNQADPASIATRIISITATLPVSWDIASDEQAGITPALLSVTVGSPTLGYDPAGIAPAIVAIESESVLVGGTYALTEAGTIGPAVVSIASGAEAHGTDRTDPDAETVTTSLISIGMSGDFHGTDRTAAELCSLGPSLLHIGLRDEMHGTDKTPPDVGTVSTAILQITRT